MIDFTTMLYNSHERTEEDPGSWTPVSYGVDWESALRTATAMTRFLSDYDYVATNTKKGLAILIAAELVLARATPGASLETITKRFWPAEPFDEPPLNHWKWVLNSLEPLYLEDNPFHAEGEQKAYLASLSKETIEEAYGELLIAFEWVQMASRLSPVKFLNQIAEVYDGFKRAYPKPYAQPWDAPDTLELVLVRRDQL